MLMPYLQTNLQVASDSDLNLSLNNPLNCQQKQEHHQWTFQDPKLEVPTIYKAYVLGLCKEISPHNMALYGTVPPI